MLRRIERVMNTLLESQRFNTPTAMKELVFNIDNGPGFFIVQSLGRPWIPGCRNIYSQLRNAVQNSKYLERESDDWYYRGSCSKIKRMNARLIL
jgi:hypothetical protein